MGFCLCFVGLGRVLWVFVIVVMLFLNFFFFTYPSYHEKRKRKKRQKFQAAKFTLLSRFCVDFKNTDKSRRAMCDLTLFLVDTVHLLRLPVLKVRS